LLGHLRIHEATDDSPALGLARPRERVLPAENPLNLATARRRRRAPDAISNAIDYAKFRSPSHRAVIRVYDEAGNVIETHEHAGEFTQSPSASWVDAY